MPLWIPMDEIRASAACAFLCITQCSALAGSGPSDAACSPPAGDIVETAVGAGSFKTLAAAIQAAGLVETLKGSGPFTVFAPTDEAFAKLPSGTVDSLLQPENKAVLVAVLTYHVVPGKVMAKEAVTLKCAPTVNGQRMDLAVVGDVLKLDGKAKVVTADVECSNGVIHVIDTVILPVQQNLLEVAAAAGSCSTLAAAIKAAGLTDAIASGGPFTVFAPTDEAFRKLPAGTLESLLKPENKDRLAAILKFHVIPGRVYADQVVKMSGSGKTLEGDPFMINVVGGKVNVGNSAAMATVTATDVEASNGVIHVIDTVLIPE